MNKAWMRNSTTIFVAFVLTTFLAIGPSAAIELEQFTGAAHAYPAMLDLNGRLLAEGEFTQQIQDDLLRIRITYDLTNGGRIEEKRSPSYQLGNCCRSCTTQTYSDAKAKGRDLRLRATDPTRCYLHPPGIICAVDCWLRSGGPR